MELKEGEEERKRMKRKRGKKMGDDSDGKRVRVTARARLVRKKKKKRPLPLRLLLPLLPLTLRQSKIGRTSVGQIVQYLRSEARSWIAFVVFVVFAGEVTGRMDLRCPGQCLSQPQYSKDDRSNRHEYECHEAKEVEEMIVATRMMLLLLLAYVRRGRENRMKYSGPLKEVEGVEGVEGVQGVVPL